MPTVVNTPHNTYIGAEFQSANGYFRRNKWIDPVAAVADNILNDSDITSGAIITTFAAQPDFARKLTLVASGSTTGNVDIVGTNVRGESISETIALNNTTPVVTTKAFKTVVSIDPPAAAVTIDVGVNDALGLDRCMSEAAVVDTFIDGVREGTAATVTSHATDVSKNTIDPNTALNASRDVVVIFCPTELRAQ